MTDDHTGSGFEAMESAAAPSPGFDPLDVTEPENPNRIWLVIGIIVLAVVVLGMLYFVRQTVEVPLVVGLTAEQAEAALVEADLRLGATSEEPTLTVEPGIVIGQSPTPASTAQSGSAVDLVVSAVPVVEVPDVTRLAAGEAEEALAVAGLRTGEVTAVYTDESPAGTVVAQEPESGTEVQIASAVDVSVSAGPEQGKVPNVVGLASADAADTLEAAGFAVRETKTANADVAAGVVITQSPAAGTVVEAGTTVTIDVSKGAPAAAAPPAESEQPPAESEQPPAGSEEEAPEQPRPEPEPELAEVPDVVGFGPLEAFRELRKADLQVKIAWGPSADAILKVISQDPGAGASVDPGTVVTVTIGLPEWLFGVEAQPLPSEPDSGAEESGAETGTP